MTTFDERERAFEAKFAHDEEETFMLRARRDRLLGEWAGAALGKTGAALDVYAGELVRSDVDTTDDETLIARVEAELAGRPEAGQVRARLADIHARLRTEHDGD